MEDIRVVHDQSGVYSDWLGATDSVEPWLTRHWHDYIEGKLKPHYPVPATEDVNLLARPCERVSFLSKRIFLMRQMERK